MAKKNHHPVSAEVENNPLYHDTYKLLRCYRDSTYSLMVAVRQVEIQFQLEYNTSVDEFLDSIYAAGADLGDSQIEEWAKSIARSNKMIKLLLSSVDLLLMATLDGNTKTLLPVSELPCILSLIQ